MHEQESPPCSESLPPPPLLTAGDALFLDVDGCLLELAPSPEEVVVPAGLAALLQDLAAQLKGAIAIVSGRSLDSVDALLAPWRPFAAGVHGAELRLPGSLEIRRHAPIGAQVAIGLRWRFQSVEGILVEDKGSSVAIHFARCPERAAECEGALIEAINGIPGLRLQRGRAVLEAVPSDSDKGGAVAVLMQQAPFAGLRPVSIGDDRTDEAAFAVARSMGGVGIKVGAGLTLAPHRLPGPPQVLRWLRASLDSLRGSA